MHDRPFSLRCKRVELSNERKKKKKPKRVIHSIAMDAAKRLNGTKKKSIALELIVVTFSINKLLSSVEKERKDGLCRGSHFQWRRTRARSTWRAPHQFFSSSFYSFIILKYKIKTLWDPLFPLLLPSHHFLLPSLLFLFSLPITFLFR